LSARLLRRLVSTAPGGAQGGVLRSEALKGPKRAEKPTEGRSAN
jgi:hypothetical protein